MAYAAGCDVCGIISIPGDADPNGEYVKDKYMTVGRKNTLYNSAKRKK